MCLVNVIIYLNFFYLKEKDDERVPLAHKSPFTEFKITLVSLIFLSSSQLRRFCM